MTIGDDGHQRAHDQDVDDPDDRTPAPWGNLVVSSFMFGVVLVGLWAVGAGVAGWVAAQNLEVAREHLIAAERSLRDAELSVARSR